MSTTRRTLNKLHEELSLWRGELLPRYRLWLDLKEAGYDPDTLSPKDAADWCEASGFAEVAKKLLSYDPGVERPEEVFARLAGIA